MSEAWKEVDEVYSISCKELMGIPNCVASGFAEMERGKKSRKGKCIGQILILSLDIATIKQCYELQKSNMSVWS
jgi:hypothetical protein